MYCTEYIFIMVSGVNLEFLHGVPTCYKPNLHQLDSIHLVVDRTDVLQVNTSQMCHKPYSESFPVFPIELWSQMIWYTIIESLANPNLSSMHDPLPFTRVPFLRIA